MHAEEM